MHETCTITTGSACVTSCPSGTSCLWPWRCVRQAFCPSCKPAYASKSVASYGMCGDGNHTEDVVQATCELPPDIVQSAGAAQCKLWHQNQDIACKHSEVRCRRACERSCMASRVHTSLCHAHAVFLQVWDFALRLFAESGRHITCRH